MKKIIFLLSLMFSILNISQAVIMDAKTKEGEEYKIEILLTSPEKNTLYFEPSWGVDGSELKTIIVDIKVKHNGKEYKVPLSAYCDLANIFEHNIWTEPMSNGFKVIMMAGDAANAYEVKYVFINGILQIREVKHGELPDINWETTYYVSDETI